MAVEKQSIELEVTTSKAKQSLEQLNDYFKKLQDKYTFEVNPKLNVDELNQQLKEALIVMTEFKNKKFELLSKSEQERLAKTTVVIATLKDRIRELGGTPVQFKTKNLDETKEDTKEIKENIDGISNKSSSAGINLGNAFGKATKSLKKFALSLFGIRSLFSAISKAARAYMNQNKQMQSTMKAVWAGLGSLLAPVLNVLANAFLKLLGYVNEFTKALWNFDFVADANKKTLEEYRKQVQKTSKALGTIDELTNLQQQDKDEGPQGLINIPELDSRIVKGLQDLAYWLKENWDWLGKVLIAIGAVFGVSAVAGWLGNIAGLIGSAGAGLAAGAGLLGVLGVLTAIAAIGAIVITIKYVTEANKAAKDWMKATDTLVDQTNKGTDAVIETNNVQQMFSEISELATIISNTQDTLTGMSWGEGLVSAFEGTTQKQIDKMETFEDNIDKIMNKLAQLREQGKLNADQEKYYQKLLEIREQRINKKGASVSFLNSKNYAGMTEKNVGSLLKAENIINDTKQLYTDVKKIFEENPVVLKVNIENIKTDEDAKNYIQGSIEWIESKYKIKFPTDIKNPKKDEDIKTTLTNAINWIESKYKIKFPTDIKNPKKDEDIKTTLTNARNWLQNKYGITLPVEVSKTDTKESTSTKISKTLKTFSEWICKQFGITIPVNLQQPSDQKTQSWADKLKQGLGKALGVAAESVGGVLGWLWDGLKNKVDGFAIGTDRVLSDGLAYIHKGEQIVPADAVKGGWTGGNNEETNSLLRQLIDAVNDKNFTATISSNDIGRASVKYINDQKRIMGGSVI